MYQISFDYEGKRVVLDQMPEISKKRLEKGIAQMRAGNGIINAIHTSGVTRQYYARKMLNIEYKKI